jgi:hypothetical protein
VVFRDEKVIDQPNRIGDEGAWVLTALADLTSLNLQGNSITADGRAGTRHLHEPDFAQLPEAAHAIVFRYGSSGKARAPSSPVKRGQRAMMFNMYEPTPLWGDTP